MSTEGGEAKRGAVGIAAHWGGCSIPPYRGGRGEERVDWEKAKARGSRRAQSGLKSKSVETAILTREKKENDKKKKAVGSFQRGRTARGEV